MEIVYKLFEKSSILHRSCVTCLNTHGPAALQRAIEAALTWGCSDQAAVRQLLLTTGLARPVIAPIAIGPALTPYHRALPSVAEYDTLLSREASQ